ncbi:MAG: PAS domain S-box protein, partial [Candidatus Riflebacteria bacterium]
MNRRIFLADDEAELLRYYKKIFEPRPSLDFFGEGVENDDQDVFKLELFNDGVPLLQEFERLFRAGERIPLCILDMRMITLSGLEIAERLRKIDDQVSIVIVTAFSDYSAKEIRKRLKENIYYVKKPFNPDELISLTDSLLKSWNDRQLLVESRSRLDSVIRSASDGIVILRSDGTIENMNPAAGKIFGVSGESLIGSPISTLLECLDSSRFKETAQETMQSSFCQEIVGKRSNSESFSAEISMGSFLVGSKVFYTLVVRDVTARKTLETALKESEKRWQFAIEGSGDGLWDWNAQTNKVFFSKKWKEMLGYEAEEIGDTLMEWESRVHPDDLGKAREELKEHFSGNTEFYSNEHRMRCKDGSFKWILDRGKVISRTERGEPERVIGTHTDISARKASEKYIRELREQEEKIASQIQQSLLMGNLPRGIHSMCFFAKSIPSLAVDGDFYDFYVHNDLCVDILIGDVMGKGLAAAIIGAAMKSSFLKAMVSYRAHGGLESLPSLKHIIERVHDDVVPHLMNVDSFVSLIFARFDLRNRTLDIVNCGHPYPILCRSGNGHCVELQHGSMPMGFVIE